MAVAQLQGPAPPLPYALSRFLDEQRKDGPYHAIADRVYPASHPEGHGSSEKLERRNGVEKTSANGEESEACGGYEKKQIDV
jgi:hypothetical protein